MSRRAQATTSAKAAPLRLRRLGEVVPVKQGIEVEYQRRDTLQLLYPTQDVKTVLSGGVAQEPRSYAFVWIIPTQGTDSSRGNLLELTETAVRLTNEGPYELHVEMLRPYGFVTDPDAIAHWEVLGNKRGLVELRSGSSTVVHVRHHFNNFICPRQTQLMGKDGVHLFSMALSRAIVSSAGCVIAESIGRDAVQLRISVDTVYKADGDVVGPEDCYVVRTYEDTKHMRVVNIPPAPSISLGSLRGENGQIISATLDALPFAGNDRKQVSGYCTGAYLNFWSADGKSTNVVDGLDENTVYLLSHPVPCYSLKGKSHTAADFANGKQYASTGSYLAFKTGKFTPSDNSGYGFYTNRQWVLCTTGAVEQLDITNFAYMYGGDPVPGEKIYASMQADLDGSFDLYPVRRVMKKVKVRGMKAGTVRSFAKMVGRVDKTEALQFNFADKLLSAVSVVVRVLKTALAIASILGVAQTLDDADGRFSPTLSSPYVEIGSDAARFEEE